MKTNAIAQDSGWNVSFWFAVSSPLLGVLLGLLAAAIFVDDRRSHEHNTNHLRLDHSTVRFRFDRTGQARRNTIRLAEAIAQELSRFSEISIFESLRKK